jgi:carbon monoxide dehydrogenase subunit G
MEVKLDKRYPIAASLEQAWVVLRDIRAVAACMPGAQITEQIDDSHFKGTVKSKVGPAVMSFGGDIELQGLDAQARSLQMLGKGADKAGSSASMQLTAHLESGADPGSSVLVGQATIVVSGKLAQFGSRLLVPVSDAMLAQFAGNFSAAAAAAVVASGAVEAPAPASADAPEPASASAQATASLPAAPAPVKELNALALMWTVFKGWLAGLFGGGK